MLLPRLRIVVGDTIVLGPGKADLLVAFAKTGTLRDAAASLDMSYMRAWTLVQTMNDAFREPLVVSERGGSRHGRAALTKSGRAVLRLYRRMQRDAARAARPASREIVRYLR
jgi:molybdate transport system regulatory protein